MNVAVALVIVPVLFAFIGYLPLRGRLNDWLSLHPVGLPRPSQLKLIWIGSLALYGVGIVMAGAERDPLVLVGFIVPIISATWATLLVRRGDFRNAFFFLCAGWTLVAIVAAWTYALNRGASLLTLPLLVTLTLGGIANFSIWQRPPEAE